MTAPDPRFLALAIEAVLEAGRIQLAHFGGPMQVDKKGEIDLVTEVDLAVERRFRALVAERFPTHVVLGEELQEDEGPRVPVAGHCWVFDPVDGTTNYAHGLPIFCASLGLEIDGRVEVAAVYDPTRRELFTAERGQGARLNGVPLRVSNTRAVSEALLVTGFPYDVRRAGSDILGLFGHFIARSRAVRRLGSAALDLCYVAAGRLDAYWESRLKPWDTCAGALIVEEAGGQVTTWDGAPYQSRDLALVASNGHLQAEMLAEIAAYQRSRSGNRTE
jgi:myo-inositol-1(or 4)-monophosphatase